MKDHRLFNLVKGKARFEVKAQDTSRSQIYLYDEIGTFGVTASDFVSEFVNLKGDVDLHVNSPGGNVFEGLAILNTIRAYNGKVVGYVDGIAASAASFILMGCDEVVMAKNSEIMIHDAWGLCIGNAGDMIDMATRLDKVSDNIADVFASKAGGSVEDWRQRMKDEGWYSPDEAVDLGLADSVAGTTEVENVYDLSRFKNQTSVAQEQETLDGTTNQWDPSAFLRAFEEARN